MTYVPELHWFVVCSEDHVILSAHGPFHHDSRGAVDFPSWREATASATKARLEAPDLVFHEIQSDDRPKVGISLRDMFAQPVTRENVIKALTPPRGETERWVDAYALSVTFGCTKLSEIRSKLFSLLMELEGERVIERRVDSEGFQKYGLDPIGAQIRQALTLGYVDVY